jgi:hypothetical protein
MDEYLAQVEEYRKWHPEIDRLLGQFGILREQYDRYIALVSAPPARTDAVSTTQGSYNANVSSISRQY